MEKEEGKMEGEVKKEKGTEEENNEGEEERTASEDGVNRDGVPMQFMQNLRQMEAPPRKAHEDPHWGKGFWLSSVWVSILKKGLNEEAPKNNTQEKNQVVLGKPYKTIDHVSRQNRNRQHLIEILEKSSCVGKTIQGNSDIQEAICSDKDDINEEIGEEKKGEVMGREKITECFLFCRGSKDKSSTGAVCVCLFREMEGSPRKTYEDPHWGKAFWLSSVWLFREMEGSPRKTYEDPHWGKAFWLSSVWLTNLAIGMHAWMESILEEMYDFCIKPAEAAETTAETVTTAAKAAEPEGPTAETARTPPTEAEGTTATTEAEGKTAPTEATAEAVEAA
ncbi:hypothetical protein ACROYT_G044776 [Oculina patagonica]